MLKLHKSRVKSKLGFGTTRKRRSYYLDTNMVIDHVTGKTATPKVVLGGDLDILR